MQKEMEKNGVEMKKGAWTKEEDILLRNCIEKHGEGKWHQVPLRAGLNRCKKSCRLRWMNYLRPNIKRGYLTKDEIDLIVRLHKLLGNRWSLIAGRLPGRTANDVKNFWNTHIVKKPSAARENCKTKTMQKTITKSNIIKPRPRTLTITKLQVPPCPSEVSKPTDDENLNKKQPSSSSQEETNDRKNSHENSKNNQPSPSLSQEEVDECFQWWSNLFEVTENEEGLCGPANNHNIKDGLSSLSVDVDVLELLSFDLQ